MMFIILTIYQLKITVYLATKQFQKVKKKYNKINNH